MIEQKSLKLRITDVWKKEKILEHSINDVKKELIKVASMMSWNSEKISERGVASVMIEIEEKIILEHSLNDVRNLKGKILEIPSSSNGGRNLKRT